jgi:hypothetical protein
LSTAQYQGRREICTSVSPVSFPSARDLHGEGVRSYHRSMFFVAHGVDRIVRWYLRGFVVCFGLDASGGEMILVGGGRGWNWWSLLKWFWTCCLLYQVVAYSSPFVAIIWCIVACLKKQLTSSICVCLNHIFVLNCCLPYEICCSYIWL